MQVQSPRLRGQRAPASEKLGTEQALWHGSCASLFLQKPLKSEKITAHRHSKGKSLQLLSLSVPGTELRNPGELSALGSHGRATRQPCGISSASAVENRSPFLRPQEGKGGRRREGSSARPPACPAQTPGALSAPRAVCPTLAQSR